MRMTETLHSLLQNYSFSYELRGWNVYLTVNFVQVS